MKLAALAIAMMVATACGGGSGSSADAPPQHRSSGMGIDAFGHTQMSEERATVTPKRKAHLERLIASLRQSLPKYRDVARATADGYRPEGPEVPIGALKHFINYSNLHVNWQHLDPYRPMALLYRRTATGYDLAGVMFTAPITTSMDDLDDRVPLAYGHWHSHRNICEPKSAAAPLTRDQAREFGFSGSINTKSACDAAGGAFMDNAFGWMVHVYPFENDVARQF
jgi:hypothetical protein